MIEYKIHRQSSLKFVKVIWKKFFPNCDQWHITLEGPFMELRVPGVIRELELYLKRKKIKFDRFPYTDPIGITAKYQNSFERIFHGFSHLSMHVDRRGRKETDQVLERCLHLACNILGYNLQEEAKIVNKHSLGRSYMAGYIEAESRWFAKEEKKHAKKKTKVQKK